MLRYFPVTAPLMVIFGLLPWMTDLFWLRYSLLFAYLFLQYKLVEISREEAESDADANVYPPNWRPAEGVLIFVFVMSCFVGIFTLFASFILTALMPQMNLEQTQAVAKGLLLTSSGILLIYELSLPATKIEDAVS